MNKSGSKNELIDRYFRKNSVGWIVLLFFVSAWMFTLGILIGRGTIPPIFNIDKVQKELKARKDVELKKEKDQVKFESDTEVKKTDLEFYTELKKTGEKRKKSQNEVKKKKERRSSTKKQIVKKNSQDPKKKFTIQVASFRDIQDARKMVYVLNKKGYTAYRIVGRIPEKGTWYRVRTGSFDTWEQANQTLLKLKKDKYSGIIVNRE